MKTTIQNLQNEFSKNFFMYVPLTVLFQSCLGSIAMMQLLPQGRSFFVVLQIVFCVLSCMLYNGTIFATLKPSIVFKMLGITVLGNSLIIILSMI